jgi:hypothetical protein
MSILSDLGTKIGTTLKGYDNRITALENVPTSASLDSGGEITGMLDVSTSFSSQDDWQNSPITIRERGRVQSTQTDVKYAPNLNFHWAGKVSRSLYMDVSGNLYYGEYNSDGTPLGVKIADNNGVIGNGKVLQVVEYVVPSTNDNYVSIGSGVQWDTPITITMTPKSSTSKLYIEVDSQFRINGAFGMSVGIKRDGVKIPGNYNRSAQMFIYKGETLNHHYNPRTAASVISGNTNATTFTVWYEPYNGTGEFNYGWGRNAIKIIEVEA